MLKKLGVCCCALAWMLLVLTGCGSQNIRLSDSDEDVVAAFAADLLLKYDPDYTRSVMMTPEQAAQKVMTGEVIKTDASQTKKEDEVGTTVEPASDRTENYDDRSLQGQLQRVEYSNDLSAVYSNKNLLVKYLSYQLASTYPKDKDALGVVYAKQNCQLLILKFKLTNTSSRAHKYDLMGDDIPYCLYINDETIVSPMMTLLEEDLSTYHNSIGPDQSKTGVLLFELTNAQSQNIQMLKLGAGKGDNLAYAKLK